MCFRARELGLHAFKARVAFFLSLYILEKKELRKFYISSTVNGYMLKAAGICFKLFKIFRKKKVAKTRGTRGKPETLYLKIAT